MPRKRDILSHHITFYPILLTIRKKEFVLNEMEENSCISYALKSTIHCTCKRLLQFDSLFVAVSKEDDRKLGFYDPYIMLLPTQHSNIHEKETAEKYGKPLYIISKRNKPGNVMLVSDNSNCSTLRRLVLERYVL